MLRGINKVILIGNLGADPDVRYTTSGQGIASFQIATSETWKDKNTGEPAERTEWHRIVLFNRLAEISGQYLKKGSKVYIEGSIRTRKWQDKSGQDKYITEIVGNQMQILDSKALNKKDQNTVSSDAVNDNLSEGSNVILDDDIPF